MPLDIQNPFRPGAGHMPPYLAGRGEERTQFEKLLDQDVILENAILTGLRGVGKTVLLETFKPLGIAKGWHWVGTDLSESASLTEEKLVIRIFADLAILTSQIVVHSQEHQAIGFQSPRERIDTRLNYQTLQRCYEQTPGLVSDKLKFVLELVWSCIPDPKPRGIVFAYDEAQNLSDHSEKGQYPLSLLLETFQSLQKKGIPFMLLLCGLPTLFPKLVEARTYAERMFRVISLNRLNEKESMEAIRKPIFEKNCPIRFSSSVIKEITQISGGYPYFIQFLGKEAFDFYLQFKEILGPDIRDGEECNLLPINSILQKLDSDFFAGRWAKTTHRQRDLLILVASVLGEDDEEFSVQEIVEASKRTGHSFSNSHVNQLLSSLIKSGLIYKNRHGRYSFAVPLFDRFIKRQNDLKLS